MPISIPTLFYLLLMLASARAQVSAPNCTNSNLAWVGSPSLKRSFRIDDGLLFACFYI